MTGKQPPPLHTAIHAIALNTFREAIRDKVLYNLVLFVLLITGCAILLGDLTDGQEARTIANIGLNAMLLFGVFIAIFVGVGLVSKEIEKRTVYAIFAKPISRTEFIIGKYFGLCTTLFVNIFIMGVGVSLALLYVGHSSMALTIWGGIVLIFLELTILTAIAIVFSSFSSPSLSALLTFLIFIIGHLSASLRQLAEGLGSSAAVVIIGVVMTLCAVSCTSTAMARRARTVEMAVLLAMRSTQLRSEPWSRRVGRASQAFIIVSWAMSSARARSRTTDRASRYTASPCSTTSRCRAAGSAAGGTGAVAAGSATVTGRDGPRRGRGSDGRRAVGRIRGHGRLKL